MSTNNFAQEKARLCEGLDEMGRRVLISMDEALVALRTMDWDGARVSIGADDEVDAMEHRMEQSLMTLIAHYQPVGKDLRSVAATLKIVADMERVADQCADICEMVLTLEGSLPGAYERIEPMFLLARQMFEQALCAYREEDMELALSVCNRDDQLDELFSVNVMELSAQIPNSPEKTPQIVDYMFIVKYIERMGDHAANIAQWTVYAQTGDHPDMNRQRLK